MDAIENLMKTLAGGGWGDLDISHDEISRAAREQSQKETTELDRQAKIVARALETEDGRALLDLLVRITVMRPPTDEERAARTAEDFTIQSALRRGQNSILFWLLARLQHFHGQPASGGEP